MGSVGVNKICHKLTHSLQTHWQDLLRVRAAAWSEVGGREVEHVLAELLSAAGEELGDGDTGSGWR